MEVTCEIVEPIQPNLGENGLDWLCYLAGNFQRAPTIFFIFSEYFFLNYFIKSPQTRNARAFLPLNISAVGSVCWLSGLAWPVLIWSFLPKTRRSWSPSITSLTDHRVYLSWHSIVAKNMTIFPFK